MTGDSGGWSRLQAPPIFVVGAPRSGTTWVYEILTAPPVVAGVYESFLFSDHDGVGGLFGEVQWRDRQGVGVGQLVPREELVADLRQLTTQWLGRVIGPEQRFLVEKSPSHLQVAEVILEILGDARFVYVLRDGRDVLVSSRAAGRSWASEWRRRRLPVELPPLRAARAWAEAHRDAVQLQARLPGGSFMTVRYEDLRHDPFPWFRKLYDFCGIPYDEELLQQVFEQTDFDRNYSGGEDQFRRGGRVGDWKKSFGLADRIAFEVGSQGALVEAGYESSRRWPFSARD